MTKFNPENKEKLTFGESLDPAMKITDPEDAKQYLQAYVAFIQKNIDADPTVTDKNAEEIAKINLAYYAGYGDTEQRERVERLFSCAHPIFGSIAEKGQPTPGEAFKMGMKLGEEIKNKI